MGALRVQTIGIALLACACLVNAGTYSVLNNADAGPGSLRQAVLDVNASTGPHTISFSLPGDNPEISVTSPLPIITATLLIDGARVTLVGPGNYAGLEVMGEGIIIRRLHIKNFSEGVRISGGRSNRIEDCTLTDNSLGAVVDRGRGHEILASVISGNGAGIAALVPTRIQGNRIFANDGLGIDYANTNYPVLSHAVRSSSSTLISGAVTGPPQTTYRIELFGNDACDPSGFGEGQRFLGHTIATTDDTGRGPFAFDFFE